MSRGKIKVVVEGPNQFAFHEALPEKVSAGLIRIRVETIGLCASDAKIVMENHPFAQYPLILGHEFSGKVLEVGGGCTIRTGYRVAVFPLLAFPNKEELNSLEKNLISSSKRNFGQCDLSSCFGKSVKKHFSICHQ